MDSVNAEAGPNPKHLPYMEEQRKHKVISFPAVDYRLKNQTGSSITVASAAEAQPVAQPNTPSGVKGKAQEGAEVAAVTGTTIKTTDGRRAGPTGPGPTSSDAVKTTDGRRAGPSGPRPTSSEVAKNTDGRRAGPSGPPPTGSDVAQGFQLTKNQKKKNKRRRRQATKQLGSLNIQGGQGVKRPKESEGSTPGTSQTSRPPTKVARTSSPVAPTTTFANVAKQDLMVYVCGKVGEAPLNDREVLALKKHLNKVYLQSQAPRIELHVLSTKLERGKMIVRCADSSTLNWIRQECDKLTPAIAGSDRSGYHVRGPGELPPAHRAFCFVTEDIADSKEEFFTLLSSNNHSLVGLMSQIHCTAMQAIKPNPPQYPLEGFTLILAIEEQAWKALEDLNFRPFCGVGGQVFIRTKERVVNQVASAAEAASSEPMDSTTAEDVPKEGVTSGLEAQAEAVEESIDDESGDSEPGSSDKAPTKPEAGTPPASDTGFSGGFWDMAVASLEPIQKS